MLTCYLCSTTPCTEGYTYADAIVVWQLSVLNWPSSQSTCSTIDSKPVWEWPSHHGHEKTAYGVFVQSTWAMMCASYIHAVNSFNSQDLWHAAQIDEWASLTHVLSSLLSGLGQLAGFHATDRMQRGRRVIANEPWDDTSALKEHEDQSRTLPMHRLRGAWPASF